MKSADYVNGLRAAFTKEENKGAAVAMKNYMRNQFEYFGIKSTPRRIISKAWMKEHPVKEYKFLKEIILLLWKQPERDFQYFGMELFGKFSKKNFNENDIKLIEFMIINKSWWDTVDFIASHLAGDYMRNFPGKIKEITGRWNNSDNLWLQRTSLLFQLSYKKETDTMLLTKYINQLAGEENFFIRKAIGWILREYSKTNPVFVKKFIKENMLSTLSKKEGLKNLTQG